MPSTVLPSFPTRRSSDLPLTYSCTFQNSWTECGFAEQAKAAGRASLVNVGGMRGVRLHTKPGDSNVDRKSTRLNSSHLVISYAVFCLKKKSKIREPQ